MPKEGRQPPHDHVKPAFPVDKKQPRMVYRSSFPDMITDHTRKKVNGISMPHFAEQ
ncbi:hypothetical protein SCOCK_80104 [Actinacidiphila cocklensis]|uniref:Uncharacterized protein n=1 Tax=Actinacidiphila cocklensis TaxID=887465 RepID=A0A9W4DZZ9_9ACTN|nr:hypothetical protein SCOCK_80104 [Actinacidiphila cocklensis]